MTHSGAHRQEVGAALGDSAQRYQALLEEAQREAQELSLKARIRQALTLELELPQVIQTVVEAIAQTLGYRLVSLYLLDGDVLELQHQVGYIQLVERLPVTQGIRGRVARTGQPVLLEDVHSDPAFEGAMDGITSEVCVPLTDQGRVVGILNVESTQDAKLTDADLHLMLALSEEVGSALERARLSGGMRESQQRFESAVRYAAIGMALVTIDGRFLQVNPALCQLVGYSEEELLATNFQAITHPDDLEADLEYVRQLLAGEIQTYQMEKRYFHKRGQAVWVLLSVSLMRDSQDRPLYFISQIQDIDRRKQAEADLRETNAKLNQGLAELLRQARQMEVLNAITRSAIEAADLRQVLPTLADRLGELLHADAAAINLWDEGQQQMIPAAASADSDEAYPALRLEPGEATMTASVLRAGHTLVAEDVFNTPYISPRIAALFPTRSMLGLPLIAGAAKLGAALIVFFQPHLFTADEIALGEQAAGQIALALAKAELYEAERQQRELAQALREAGAALSASLDFETVLDRILEQIGRVVPYDAANLMLLEGTHVRVARMRGYEQFGEPVARDITALSFEISTTANLRCMAETGRPLVISDTAADPNWVTVEATAHMRSWAGAPIVAQGQVIAFFSVDKTEPNFYRPQDGERLAAFAGQAAAALENARLHAEVSALATIDGLTGLPNRRAFDRAREQEIARAERFGHSLALIVLDMDSFKQYNDSYGHPAGDERLRSIAHLLRDIVRTPDFSARYGGEEFSVLLPQTNKQGGSLVAERIRLAAEAAAPATTPYGSYVPGYTCSLGVAAFPEDAQTSEALLLAADNAELSAKRRGKNRVCVAGA